MSLLGVINHFRTPGSGASGAYTVTRQAPGAYASLTGKYVAGSASTFTIIAAVHPYSPGRHQVVIPEGMRTEDVRVLWTATELKALDASADADTVTVSAGPSFTSRREERKDRAICAVCGDRYPCTTVRILEGDE